MHKEAYQDAYNTISLPHIQQQNSNENIYYQIKSNHYASKQELKEYVEFQNKMKVRSAS